MLFFPLSFDIGPHYRMHMHGRPSHSVYLIGISQNYKLTRCYMHGRPSHSVYLIGTSHSDKLTRLYMHGRPSHSVYLIGTSHPDKLTRLYNLTNKILNISQKDSPRSLLYCLYVGNHLDSTDNYCLRDNPILSCPPISSIYLRHKLYNQYYPFRLHIGHHYINYSY